MKGPTDEIDGTRLKSWCKVCFCACRLNCFSCVRLFATLWTVAHQTLLSMRLSRQEYWSGLPFLSPGDHPDPGIEPMSFISPALAGKFFTTSATWETPLVYYNIIVNTICHIYIHIHTYTIYIYMPPSLFLAIIFVFLKSIFNLRIITLQYCVGFLPYINMSQP